MKLLAVIPARGGSKRLPGKNIRFLGNKPLITWTVESTHGHQQIVATLVSTDSTDIAKIAATAGAFVPWRRPDHLATDEATTVDVCLHALDWYESNIERVDGVLLLQPTSPFRQKKTLTEAIKLFSQHPDVSVISVSPAKTPPHWCCQILDGRIHPIMDERYLQYRSQDLPKAFVISGTLYIIPTSVLRQQRTLFSEGSQAVVLSSVKEGLDIDSVDDWELAEFYLNRDF